MASTGIVADVFFQKHDTGSGHPERPERLKRIYSELREQNLWDAVEHLPLVEASEEQLLKAHTREHLRTVQSTSERSRSYLDGDTPTSSDSYQAALLAAGSLCQAVSSVASGELKNAFALVRPPGHHAEKGRSMGFCLFNNIAVAAHHALDRHGLRRILIVDWDVHHGNGTQNAFYSDPRVAFFSTHRYPFYPGTGYFDEIGSGPGQGYTVNVPLPGGCDDAIYDAIFETVLSPVARGFKPELILVSAGFDSHCHDPLGGMMVTEQGFARMAGRVLGLAKELCDDKVVLTLEGGYDLEGLAKSVAEVIALCLGKKQPPQGSLRPDPGIKVLLEKEKEFLGESWPGIGSQE